jgi:hypothetical protein
LTIPHHSHTNSSWRCDKATSSVNTESLRTSPFQARQDTKPRPIFLSPTPPPYHHLSTPAFHPKQKLTARSRPATTKHLTTYVFSSTNTPHPTTASPNQTTSKLPHHHHTPTHHNQKNGKTTEENEKPKKSSATTWKTLTTTTQLAYNLLFRAKTTTSTGKHLLYAKNGNTTQIHTKTIHHLRGEAAGEQNTERNTNR